VSIEWSSGFSTGLVWQDRQHRELFRRINALLDAMTVGLGRVEVERIFKFLDEYFAVHFEAEERAMHGCAYPEELSHVKEHSDFIERMAALRTEFAEGATTRLVIKVQKEVVDWLINHIGGVDRALGLYLVRAGKRPRPE